MPPSSSAFIFSFSFSPPFEFDAQRRLFTQFSHFPSLCFPLHLHLWPSSLSSVCCFSFNLLRLTNMFTSPSFSPPLNILIFHYLSLSSFVRQITTLLCAQSLSSSLPPSPPLCLFPSGFPLCCCLSCFSPHVSITLFYFPGTPPSICL